MFQKTPVYDRLVAERGDVPALVRGEADRLHHQLAPLLRLMPAARPRQEPPGASGPSAPSAQWT
ncbi:hypothetical protein ACFVWY_04455 [Streptomyces sp. NPDC058195]|uniref:hypothetical protein n=1 Tax=Streptomyces sp. NPDC058195 TaxID=3346375 RepID=UPI0036E984DF